MSLLKKQINFNLPDFAKTVFSLLESHDKSVFLVGGSLRDLLLGLSPNDYDFATDASLKDLNIIFRSFKKVNKNGLRHGTFSIIIDEHVVEITTFRDEKTTLEGDLRLRDFTINSFAYSPKNGLYGLPTSFDDLENKTIRLDNGSKTLEDDPVRLMRALRFSSVYGFNIEEETSKLLNENRSLLKSAAKERVRDELLKILTGKNAFDILLNYKEIIFTIIPKLKTTSGFMQNNKYHKHQDVYEHIINVVKNTTPNEEVRMAALLHDIAKPDTYTEEIEDGKPHGHFYGHANLSAIFANDILLTLRFSNEEIERITFLVKYHDFEFTGTKKNSRKIIKLTPGHDLNLIALLIDLRKADRMDHVYANPDSLIDLDKVYNEIINAKNEETPFDVKDLNIDGYDLIKLGLNPGKLFINIFNELLNKVLLDELPNEKDALINYVKNSLIPKM